MGRHKATFEGKVIKKSWTLGLCDALVPIEQQCEYQPFFEGVIDLDPIEVEGKVYIPGFNEYVVVTDRQRNTKNEWTYQTDKVIKTIEDKESLEKAIQKQEKIEEFNQQLKQEYKRFIEEEEKRKTSWWKRLITKKDQRRDIY
ncbi:hypothetical protein NSU09_12280 [Bacillus sp. PS194]|uniref:hypothetical protein n=1 Tax=unclassified Bacillus (in: firmicutes) TaxID=185979 RepID=UPI0004E43C87|nr:hypothetical protein [Bacillus]MBL3637664.1 hypothetical protein [Alkalicoccobacillus gibsonii]WIT26993.1 hypothetical protein [Bacillus phage SPbetaL2]KAA0937006.1 hypothetical protein FQ086_05360 [Bacillus sp. ANT_WA51]KFC32387.1 hypothetical protein ZQL_05495 [Bacillus subtilis]MBE0185920.1 hypothetical protein [Bacillus subtilis]